ncbi:MAG: dTDP-4-dehydrorhamnose 3,5-epimerase [Bacteroidales bacterium]|nr:dTDP-4-dehydrorhamnose 3,5-epimerase [Bacteroidales bacterium]
MEILKTEFDGLLILRPRVFGDARGYFFEKFSLREFQAVAGPVVFVQENQSRSVYGVVRGLHFQKEPYAQAKLVSCVRGRVLDVVLDLRRDSATFGKHFSIELSSENHLQMYVPKGFAHGFSVLSPEAVFQYKCDEYYHPEAEDGVQALDPALGIDWKIPAGDMIMSDKDAARHNLLK